MPISLRVYITVGNVAQTSSNPFQSMRKSPAHAISDSVEMSKISGNSKVVTMRRGSTGEGF